MPAGLLAALCLTAAVANPEVRLTLDGRPVDRRTGIAVLRHGVVYADAIDLTKSFNGFITLERSGAATITIGPNTGTFTPRSSRATINALPVVLPGAPFTRDGELFVPLEAFSRRIAGADVQFDSGCRQADIRVDR